MRLFINLHIVTKILYAIKKRHCPFIILQIKFQQLISSGLHYRQNKKTIQYRTVLMLIATDTTSVTMQNYQIVHIKKF